MHCKKHTLNSVFMHRRWQPDLAHMSTTRLATTCATTPTPKPATGTTIDPTTIRDCDSDSSKICRTQTRGSGCARPRPLLSDPERQQGSGNLLNARQPHVIR